MQKKFRIDLNNPAPVIAALIIGVVLAVGGSALATSVGSSISVTSNLTVSGNAGVGTSTPGSLLSIQGAGNWSTAGAIIYVAETFPSFIATSTTASNGIGTTTPGTTLSVQGVGNWTSGGSTVYSTYTFPSFTATSTTANNGIGTTTPGSAFSVQGVGNFVNAATSTLYTDLVLRSLLATSTIYDANGTAAVPSYSFSADTDTGFFRAAANALGFATGGSEYMRIDSSGNVGVGTTTPGSLLSVQGVANFASAATSTFYTPVTARNYSATSTTATSTFRGGMTIATGGGSVGIGSTTPIKTLDVAGDVLVGGSATTTLSVTTSSATAGSCIQLKAASSSTMYRIYIGTPQGSLTAQPLVVEVGQCGSQAWGQ